MFTPSILLLLASAGLIEARSRHQVRHLPDAVHKRDDSTILSPEAIQSASFVDGSQQIGANEANQAKSLTSRNNFINNCVGKTLTNGLQITTGSCNGIPMGDLPAKTNMVSSIITFPLHASATIESDKTFNITVQVANLIAGSFTNADATYFSAPQFLQDGKVVGHTHVTVQDLGANLNPTTALDATQFAFFKGINDAGNGQGLLTATVTGGLPAGNYRVCTMGAASNHQPLVMPVAQRGTADDCTKFTVIGNGTTIDVAANNGSKGEAAAALAASAVAAGPGFVDATTAAAAASSSSVLSHSTTTRDSGSGGNHDKGTTTSVAAIETRKASGNGEKDVSHSTAAIETGKASGNEGKDVSTSNAAIETSKASGDGGKDASTSNAAIETSKASGDGGKDASTSNAASTSVAAKSATSATAAQGNNGNGSGSKATSGSSTAVAGKQIVTVIETFFIFEKSRGGACPSVGKSGNQFNVLGEIFEDLASAAAAACGQQFTACASFSGPGFSIEECGSQQDECYSVASTQKATATTPATQTARVIIPATANASVPGSIVATNTVVIKASAKVSSSTSAAAGGDKAIVTSSQIARATTAATTTKTSKPAVSAAASLLPTIVSSKSPFSNSTTTAFSAPAASSVKSSSAAALGGHEAHHH